MRSTLATTGRSRGTEFWFPREITAGIARRAKHRILSDTRQPALLTERL
jgi:hypothetical protein